MNLEEKNSCPRCGKAFHCSKSKKCWCMELDTPPALLERLSDEYEGCLCPDCMKELIENNNAK